MKSLLRQKQMARYKNFIGLGVAGNFALHLAQAGELEDFKNIITADEAAPKGMFPFYLPKKVSNAKDILSTYPLSSTTIKLPNETLNIQIEPEVALICEFEYKDEKVSNIIPKYFAAYNDCSIRVEGASKISDKKNWGADSKGLSDNLLEIDKFSEGGILDSYAICSFLKRGGEINAYGEDVELSGYSYFYEKLLDWLKNQLNTQEDFGPLEDIKNYIRECDFPKNAIISIGATRYTDFGEHTFLKKGDEIFVALYDKNKTSSSKIVSNIQNNIFEDKSMNVLRQKVVL